MMIRKTFNTINILVISLWIAVLWLSTIPSITLAEDNCNRWWGKCHVSDINTIHTDDEDVSSGLLDTVKNAINWILWILATVALCICMYWGFKLLTSGADGKWYKDWRTILKNAALGLWIILLAWMIVSVVFRFVGTLSWGNQTQSGGQWPVGW